MEVCKLGYYMLQCIFCIKYYAAMIYYVSELVLFYHYENYKQKRIVEAGRVAKEKYSQTAANSNSHTAANSHRLASYLFGNNILAHWSHPLTSPLILTLPSDP